MTDVAIKIANAKYHETESFTSALLSWGERAKQRRELAKLDNHMLADIGITPAARDAEIKKAFWEA